MVMASAISCLPLAARCIRSAPPATAASRAAPLVADGEKEPLLRALFTRDSGPSKVRKNGRAADPITWHCSIAGGQPQRRPKGSSSFSGNA